MCWSNIIDNFLINQDLSEKKLRGTNFFCKTIAVSQKMRTFAGVLVMLGCFTLA